MNSRYGNPHILEAVLKITAVLAVVVYVAFFTTGYFSGAMKGILAVVVAFSLWVSVYAYYPKARKTKGRIRSIGYVLFANFEMWSGLLGAKHKQRD